MAHRSHLRAIGFSPDDLGRARDCAQLVLRHLGFAASIARYPGYSADFFDGKHFVSKGASGATGAELTRRSFRNWYQARYPYVFAKFRWVRA